MESKLVKDIKAHTSEPSPDAKVTVRFHSHCIILAASMTILVVVVSMHIANETTSTALTFVPNFLTEIIDRIRKV